MIGYADSDTAIRSTPETGNPDSFVMTLQQRPVLRIGRVTALHATHLWCRGPCVETSIPIFSGMSGGLVAAFEEGHPIKGVRGRLA